MEGFVLPSLSFGGVIMSIVVAVVELSSNDLENYYLTFHLTIIMSKGLSSTGIRFYANRSHQKLTTGCTRVSISGGPSPELLNYSFINLNVEIITQKSYKDDHGEGQRLERLFWWFQDDSFPLSVVGGRVLF